MVSWEAEAPAGHPLGMLLHEGISMRWGALVAVQGSLLVVASGAAAVDTPRFHFVQAVTADQLLLFPTHASMPQRQHCWHLHRWGTDGERRPGDLLRRWWCTSPRWSLVEPLRLRVVAHDGRRPWPQHFPLVDDVHPHHRQHHCYVSVSSTWRWRSPLSWAEDCPREAEATA